MSVYNGAEFLEEAVASILSQDFSDFEFIIINDGSTDGTSSILDGLQDERIRIYHQENKGLAASLNRAIKLAKAEYIARMDGDDISLPGRLKAQFEALEENEALALVGCFYERVNQKGRVIARIKPPTDAVYRLWILQFRNLYAHGSVMMRKAAVCHAQKYDETLVRTQDYDLWSRLCTSVNTHMIPQFLYRWRTWEDTNENGVKYRQIQSDNAVLISDRWLQRCNPSVSRPLCHEMRTVYTRVGGGNLRLESIRELLNTVGTFCNRHDISKNQQADLASRVAVDVLDAATTLRGIGFGLRIKVAWEAWNYLGHTSIGTRVTVAFRALKRSFRRLIYRMHDRRTLISDHGTAIDKVSQTVSWE